MAALARRFGVSVPTARRRWDAWRKGGAEALVRRNHLPRATSRNAWETVFRKYCENDKNTHRGAWKVMMDDFRRGRTLEGVGTWRDCWAAERPFEAVPPACPGDFVPQGASYGNLLRAARSNPDFLFSITIARRGRKAAQAFLLPVLKTRLGLPVGAMTEYDDVWHNTDVLVPGRAKSIPPTDSTV